MYRDFAFIYDRVMENANYDEWYDYIKEKFDRLDFKGTDVMDLGCGTGEILLRLREDGYKVIGVDLSTEMLSVAKEKFDEMGIEIPLVNQDMIEMQLPISVDMVVSLFDTINHIVDIKDLETSFANVRTHLSDGGYFIFDIATRKLLKDMFKNGVFLDDREDMTILWRHYYDKKEKTDNITTTFFVKEDNPPKERQNVMYERIDEYHVKKIYTEEEIEDLLVKVGFQIVEKDTDNEMAGERIFYTCRKI